MWESFAGAFRHLFEKDPEEDVGPPGALLAPGKAQETPGEPCRWARGKVTRVEADFCLLDGDNYWKLPEVGDRARWEPKVGDPVSYKVRKRKGRERGGEGAGDQEQLEEDDDRPWEVVEVHKEAQDGDWFEDCPSSSSFSWLSPSRVCEGAVEATAVVLRVSSSGVRVSLVGEEGKPEMDCSWEQLGVEYGPWKGDLLSLKISEGGGGKDGGDMTVVAAEPLRSWEGCGRVKSWIAKQHIGTLHEEVFFSYDACAPSLRNPRPGDQVWFSAVECEPCRYNEGSRWRAIRVTGRAANHAARQAAAAAEVFAVEQSEALRSFLSGHAAAVSVLNAEVRLGRMHLGGEEMAEIQVQNRGEDPITFLGVARRPDGGSEPQTNVVTGWRPGQGMAATVESGATGRVRVLCRAGTLGRSAELVTLRFARGEDHEDEVEIGLVVHFDVLPPGHGGDEIVCLRLRRRNRQWMPDIDDAEVLPGRRRNVRAPSFSKFRLKEYPIPPAMKGITEAEDGDGGRALDLLMDAFPCLSQPLSPRNYSARLSTLLFLEELEQWRAIRRYDMFDVSFERRGQYLGLEVPGLAEKRPSLVLGDSVVVTRDGTLSYEGCVHEVRASMVFLQFESNFHHSYCGEVYNVTFRFNRGPFRRLHRAAEQAVGLMGRDFLFPSAVSAGTPQLKPTVAEGDDGKARTKTRRSSSKPKGFRVPDVGSVVAEGGWICPVLPPGTVGRLEGISPHCGRLRHEFSLEKEGFDPVQPYYERWMNGETRSSFCWFNSRLNREQKQAVVRILQGEARPVPYIIYGPPGTGKTVTVVECILQLFLQLPNSRLLVCTPSNSSADLIAERLAASRCPRLHRQLARFNAFNRRPESVPESVRPFSYQAGAGDADDGGGGGGGGGGDLEALLRVCRRRVVVATCATAGALHRLVSETERGAAGFTHCLVDEAGHLGEAETLLPIMLLGRISQEKGQQVVLAGDPMQLGPVVQSSAAKTCGAEESLLERLSRRLPYARDPQAFADHGCYDPLLVTKLVRNYRSHRAIIQVSSQRFYYGELKVRAPRSIRDRFVRKLDFLPNQDCPVVFHGVRGEHYQEDDSPSWFNPVEVFQLVRYVQQLWEKAGGEDLDVGDVGIITPYRKQVEKIRCLLESFELPAFKVGSVEEFQGQERPVVFISTVRCSSSESSSSSSSDLSPLWTSQVRHQQAGLGFVGCPKRTNVALTRAQSLMVVVADPDALAATDDVWRDFLLFAVDSGCYCGCELPPSMRRRL